MERVVSTVPRTGPPSIPTAKMKLAGSPSQTRISPTRGEDATGIVRAIDQPVVVGLPSTGKKMNQQFVTSLFRSIDFAD